MNPEQLARYRGKKEFIDEQLEGLIFATFSNLPKSACSGGKKILHGPRLGYHWY